MNRLALMSILALAIAGSAIAQTKPKTPVKTKTTIKCSVMSEDDVNIAKATKNKMYTDYKGRRYFFCCDSCISAFKKNPAKYAKSPSLPTPKPPAKKPS